MKHIDPNMNLSEAQIWASELHKCISDIQNRKYSSLLEFSDEEALGCGLSCPGTAKEKIQAVIDYSKCRSHPPAMRSFCESIYTSPYRIVNELLEAIKGKVDYCKAAESSDDCDISTLSSDVVLLAAQTFMFRNKHYNASDEEALHAFHEAIQYLKGEQRTSTEFIKCDSRELTGIIQSVNQHFTVESIDIIGLKIAKDVMDNINQGKEPPKPDGYVTSWDLYLLSEVECLRDIYIARKEIFRNKSDNYIYPEWERIGQNSYRWYMFCAQGKHSWKEYYAMQLKKTTTIGGNVYEFKGDFRVSEDPALLKRFQRGKINGDCTTEFQGTFEYRWSRDGKPPAHPYFIVAQLYWSYSPHNLNYQLEQVTDKEALTLLYDEMPTLEEKGKTDPTLKKTYTWFLNKPSNAVTDFPELKDYSEGQTFSKKVYYLCPSAEPLQTEGFSYEWSREEHESSHKDFTLIYRARPTLERVPQVITEENRIRFDYWQYIKEFVFFGGSASEGTVLAPDPAWIDQAHRNGVGIFGTVFLPTLKEGGNKNDIEELAKPENLQKLVDIAHRLNFEGWFLNVQSYNDYNESSLEMLKNSIKEMDLRGKEMIWYLPRWDKIKLFDPKVKGVRMTSDNEISKTATAFLEEKGKKLYFNFYLINSIFSNQAPRNYLMFVDEPFWMNTLKQRKYLVDPVRFRHAQNCLWQFFLGENGLERKPTDQFPWYGIAKYAKQRNYLLVQSKHQVKDKEALTVLYDEMPTLKEKEKEKEKNDCKTYTWFLNKPSNAVTDFPELKDYSEGQTFSEDYLSPSTEPLQTEGFSYEWSREEHESSHKDFTLMYRARPTLERVPQVITEENRIRFDYWQYIKEFVFFGGSASEGAVLAPDPAWIDQAHRNGVGIFGTVFLAPLDFGGNKNDIEELAKPENLQKLVDIAHRLNFEGWFLNVESFKDYDKSKVFLEKLKLAIKKMDLRGKEIIWYLPRWDKIKLFDPKVKGVRMTCDNEISNTAHAFLEEKGKNLYFNFYLINSIFSNQAPQNYLMYVDEPFWKNTLKQRKYLVDPVRFPHAQNCLWQFFLGENGLERKPTDQFPWYGIAKYAKQRKQLSKD
ncbi:hypothetical protein ABG768_025612 [Culter alburnus]|uniref:Cytosolic endo-beta-N-acetylglucosaminidase TIM barrel domain-containing protein n=1 Tax=Culter alburnus TaxID=194366 RepID=A0AAW2AF76_CULAL